MTDIGFRNLPVEKLKFAGWNYKTDDDELLGKLINNIKRNGFIENIIVRENEDGFEVVNGNHRLRAMHILKTADVMCYNLGSISLADAQRIAIETNETKFKVDDVRLASVLKNISLEIDIEELLSTINFSKSDLEDLLKLDNFNWDTLDSDDTGYEGDGEVDSNLKTIELSLPEELAARFQEQIDRIKKSMKPTEKELKKISTAMCIEVITAHIENIPKEKLLG